MLKVGLSSMEILISNTCTDPKGRTEGYYPPPPPPPHTLENHKKSQHSVSSHHRTPGKFLLNGISLVGQWWLALFTGYR